MWTLNRLLHMRQSDLAQHCLLRMPSKCKTRLQHNISNDFVNKLSLLLTAGVSERIIFADHRGKGKYLQNKEVTASSEYLYHF